MWNKNFSTEKDLFFFQGYIKKATDLSRLSYCHRKLTKTELNLRVQHIPNMMVD